MKDAKGHGSDHRAGVEAATKYNATADRFKASGQLAASHYYMGRVAHAMGHTLAVNPHTEPEARAQWERGFKIEQKEHRATATRAAKKAAL